VNPLQQGPVPVGTSFMKHRLGLLRSCTTTLLAVLALSVDATGAEEEAVPPELAAAREAIAAAEDEPLPVLLAHLDHESWRVRALLPTHLLRERSDPRARRAIDRLARDADPRVQAAVIQAVARDGGPRAAAILEITAGSEHPTLRAATASGLAHLAPAPGDASEPELLALLARLVTDDAFMVRHAAVLSAASYRERRVTALLTRACADSAEEVVLLAATALAERDEIDLEPLRRQAGHRDATRRLAACLAAGVLAREELDTALSRRLGDREWTVRAAAAEAIGRFAPELAGKRRAVYQRLLLKIIDDPHPGVRASAGWALARMGSREALEAQIANLARDGSAAAFHHILHELTGHAFHDVEAAVTWYREHGAQAPLQPIAIEDATTWSFYDLTATGSSIAITIDLSGSMGFQNAEGDGTRIDDARDELWTMLLDFEYGTLLECHLFDSSVLTWSEGPRRATWRNRYALRAYVDGHQPGGGTNIHDALDTALAHDLVDTVVFLTDGEPTTGAVTDPAEILERILATNDDRARPATIHSIGIGVPEMEDFLRGLAAGTGGGFRLIE